MSTSDDFPPSGSGVRIREVAELQPAEIADLAIVLKACVDEGASLGFHAPLAPQEAAAYWAAMPKPGVTLLIADSDDRVGATVQMHAASSANGAHRVEVAKLLVHPAWRRRGLAKHLLRSVEQIAQERGKRLLVLDTREGDPSNLLYAAAGYQQGGRIPDWARDAAGELTATIFWYKVLPAPTH